MKSVERLFDIYCQSVGRNSKLLLNVPPTRDGVLHPNRRRQPDGLPRPASCALRRNPRRAAAWSARPRRPQLEVVHGPCRSAPSESRKTSSTARSVARFAVHGEDARRLARTRARRDDRLRADRALRAHDAAARRVVIEDAVAPPEPLGISVCAAVGRVLPPSGGRSPRPKPGAHRTEFEDRRRESGHRASSPGGRELKTTISLRACAEPRTGNVERLLRTDGPESAEMVAVDDHRAFAPAAGVEERVAGGREGEACRDRTPARRRRRSSGASSSASTPSATGTPSHASLRDRRASPTS